MGSVVVRYRLVITGIRGLADFVGEDVHQVGVVVVEGLPQGIGIGGGAGGQGEGPPVGVQGGVAGQEGGPVLLPGGGPPLGGEGAGGQGDGVVPPAIARMAL